MKAPKKIDWPLWVMIAIAVIILFASCSSMRKIKSSEKIHSDIISGHSIDSAAVSKKDSAGTVTYASMTVSKKDSSHVKTDETNAEETISVTLRKDTAGPGHLMNDYEAAAPVISDIEIDGHKIHSSQGIDNVTIKNKNGTLKIDASKLQVSDSNAQASSQTSIRHSFDSMFKADHDTLHQELDFQSKNKEVKRTGFGFGGYALIGGGLLFLFFAWRWGWLRKKKKKDPEDKNKNPLTSVPYNPSPPPDAAKT